MNNRTILHCDLNNFYASVECLYNKNLRGKPVAVSGDPELRHGIVLAKNYLAKDFGVNTGDPLWVAKRKCREINFVPPNYDLYLRYSSLAKEIYSDFTNQVEPFGLDECWLDVSRSRSLFGDGKIIADAIRKKIKFELGVTASVGVSFNKIFAKLGSDLKKPDATTIIDYTDFKLKVWPLPVDLLLCVGRSACDKLKSHGIKTIGDLACCDRSFLKAMLGKNGVTLWTFANGLDSSPVSDIKYKPIIKSIGNGTTTFRDLITEQDIKITLYLLCESVSARLREKGLKANTVVLGIKDNSLSSYSVQQPLIAKSRTVESLFDSCFYLYLKNHAKNVPIRSLHVKATNLVLDDDYEQLSILPNIKKVQKDEALNVSIDNIRSRFGFNSIKRAVMLKDNNLAAIDPKSEHIIHPLSYFH